MADPPSSSSATDGGGAAGGGAGGSGGGSAPELVLEAPAAPAGPAPPPTSPRLAAPRLAASLPTSPKLSTLQPGVAVKTALSPKQNSPGCAGSATGNPRNKCALQPGHSLMDWTRLGNSGRDLTGVGGNPRNKCALQPGHSLMDWIRLGNSGRDLTGVGGRLRAVSPKQLAGHNAPGDAWLAIRGRVYNVTHYLPYHPGGPEELMRGAGADATRLFDDVHPWVNFESLLAKCLVGPLRADAPADLLSDPAPPAPTTRAADRLREPSKAQSPTPISAEPTMELVRKSMENLANCITPVRRRVTSKSSDGDSSRPDPSRVMQSLLHSSELPVSISRRAAAGVGPVRDVPASAAPESEVEEERVAPPPPPAPALRYDWIQTSSRLTVSVYSRALGNPGAHARLAAGGGALALAVAAAGARATLELVPEHALRPPLRLRVYPESGKVEVSAHKTEGGVWRGAGAVRWEAAAAAAAVATRGEWRVRRRRPLTHDTVLLELECTGAGGAEALAVPVGHHVKVHRTVDGEEVTRAYTPVCVEWAAAGEAEAAPGAELVCLVVKRYDAGALTPTLAALAAGDTLSLSGPYGNFELHRLKQTRRVVLLAAGTGLTPMLSLISFLLARRTPQCELVHLLFFNKTEEDIILHDKLTELSQADSRLQTTHVLSEGGAAWAGLRGRVSAELLQACVGDVARCAGAADTADPCEHFAAACGPVNFTRLAHASLQQLGMSPACFHGFAG